MKKIRYGVVVVWMLICSVAAAQAQLSIGIGLPNLSIGINLPVFPELDPVPGYPVYYAPQVDSNYFFYDGMYWVYQDDIWYASSWYNGPWGLVEPTAVPLFILRVPVRYYRQPPMYFRGWQSNAPPRWGQHWGRGWEQNRRGWDKWNRSAVQRRAPLPAYQRQYSGDRYPRIDQQHALRNQSYRYQPRDKAIREHFKQQTGRGTPEPSFRGMREEPQMRNHGATDQRQSAPLQRGAPADMHSQPPQRGGEFAQKPGQDHVAPMQHGPSLQEQRQQHREQQSPDNNGQERRSRDRDDSQDSNRGHGQGQNRDEERGRGRN